VVTPRYRAQHRRLHRLLACIVSSVLLLVVGFYLRGEAEDTCSPNAPKSADKANRMDVEATIEGLRLPDHDERYVVVYFAARDDLDTVRQAQLSIRRAGGWAEGRRRLYRDYV